MSYLRPPSPYETATAKRPAEPALAPPKFEIGHVIGRSFAIIRQRWTTLGFFVVAYLAVGWIFDAVWPFHDRAGVRDWRLAVGLAVVFGFTCLQAFRDTALTATVLETPSPSSFWASIADATMMALRAYPTLLPFFVFSVLPELIDTVWRSWSPLHLPFRTLVELWSVTFVGEAAFALTITGAWGLVVPTVTVERASLHASMRRAFGLLAGSRWLFIAMYVVVAVIGALPSALATAFVLPIYSSLHLNGPPRSAFRAELEVARVLGSIVDATWHVMIGVAYLELRRVKEGVVLGDVAEIFA